MALGVVRWSPRATKKKCLQSNDFYMIWFIYKLTIKLKTKTRVQCSVYSVTYKGISVYCTVSNVNSSVWSVYCTVCSTTVEWEVFTVQCKVFTVQCAVNTVQCAVQYIVCNVHCRVCSVDGVVWDLSSGLLDNWIALNCNSMHYNALILATLQYKAQYYSALQCWAV